MLKIRRPSGRLIFNMGIAIPGKTVFLIEKAPRCPVKLHHICRESDALYQDKADKTPWEVKPNLTSNHIIVRRAGLLWSQQDFEWRWSVPLFKCLTVLEFSFILFDLCLLITFFNFIMNYVPIVTFWIFTYHKIWILSIMFCFIWSYWIIYFLACLEVSWRVVS